MTASPDPSSAPCELTLFVSGASELSARAIADVRGLCDAHLAGRCRITILDVHTDRQAGGGSRLLATPTLVRSRPLPERRIVGDLSDAGRVLRALGLSGSDPPATG